MSMGLSQNGTTQRASAFAVAQQARANAQAIRAGAERLRAIGPDNVLPPIKVVQSPAEIRAKVMEERGLDRRDMVQLGPQARLETEISIQAETEERERQAKLRDKGALFDLKV
jgi:hypothetical protein